MALMPECCPLPQQTRNDFFLLFGATQRTHTTERQLAVAAFSLPQCSVLFHMRSVSSHSFEVAIREFPREKRLLSLNCIQGIVNRSEQSGQREITTPAAPPQGRYQVFPSPDLLASGHHLPTSSFSFNKQYFVFTGYHLPFIPTILPFCHPDWHYSEGITISQETDCASTFLGYLNSIHALHRFMLTDPYHLKACSQLRLDLRKQLRRPDTTEKHLQQCYPAPHKTCSVTLGLGNQANSGKRKMKTISVICFVFKGIGLLPPALLFLP